MYNTLHMYNTPHKYETYVHRENEAHASDVSTRRLRQLSERNETLTRRGEALRMQVGRLEEQLQEESTTKQRLQVCSECAIYTKT